MPDSIGRVDGSRDPQDLERKTAELARATQELQILQRVSSEINSTLDLDEIYEIALRTMDELFEFHHANILLLEPDGETLTVVASRGYENQAVGGRVRIGTGIIGIVAQRRKMLHVSNLGQQRMYAAAQRRQMMKSDRRGELGEAVPIPGLQNAESQFAIPLMMRDELIGVFSIESPVLYAFSEHDRGLVLIVANQIASAIHNARLYEARRIAAEALKAANASLEQRVTERTAELERELRVAQELLSDARSRVEGPLLGESAAVQALRETVTREAGRSEPLLLSGPAGAGKEAVAHAIHRASGRRGAFIFVNCAEMHSESRSTPLDPSAATRTGHLLLASKFDLAAGGTLFLDAVHELSLELQEEFQAILSAHERERAAARSRPPAGPDDRAAKHDVRVIGATIRDPASIAKGGRFVPFAAQLARNSVLVPALVDRREDIPILVDHFVRRHSRRLGKVVDRVSADSMVRLEAYKWPGNIRELRTVIERALLVSRGTVLEIDEDLLDERLAVGSYRLVSQLGSGGMGEVWLGKHRMLARPAAVKLIRHDPQQADAHAQLVRRFQREALVTADLRSPHTVQLYDFGVNDTGSFYYVMEFLQGLDLHRIVTRFGPQPAERVVSLLRQACRSLAEAHERGLVHRDIKPANLFVTRLGPEYDYLKVLDFGIVKDQPGAESTLISAQGILQGTPAFIAPEVMFGANDLDGRADLYSLACTAYWLLTGQLVFSASTPAEMVLHHARTKPIPPSEVSELPIPRELERLLMMCLEKEPRNRPSSAIEFEEQLARVRCEEPWTQERAKAWWEAHAPDAVATVQVSATRGLG